MLNKAEKAFHKDLGLYSERKKSAILRLQNMDPTLRDREHRFCMKIWSTVVGERDNRKFLEQISTTSEHLKKALELSYQHVHYSGQGQMRYYNGFVMKLWKQVHIRLTGSTLRLGHENSISSHGNSSHLDKTGSHTVMDCVNDSTGQAKSRTIMLDSIANVEISLNLPLFPRVQQALGARRSSASAETCPHDQSTKAYFIFHFKSLSSAGETMSGGRESLSTSPYLKQQREKSQTPPKHPIVLSLNMIGSSDTPSADPRAEGAVAFLNAIRAAIPDVDISGTSCLVTADTVKYIDPPADDDISFGIQNLNDSGGTERSQPLVRSSESQLNSPSDWSHLGSGRTSVESLLTANNSIDSHRTRSSHSSSQRRSTLSSLDDSGSDHDQQQIEVSDSRKRPCALGSVIEERESRYSNDTHSSHSRNNSSSIITNGNSGRLLFSNDVIMEHNRYMYHENVTHSPFLEESLRRGGSPVVELPLPPASSCSSLKTGSNHSRRHSRGSEDSYASSTILAGQFSPKKVFEKNGILCCENTSNVGDDELTRSSGLVDVDWASVDSKSDKVDTTETKTGNRNEVDKKYKEFSDTLSGSDPHHPASELLSRNRSLSLEVLAVATNESVVSPQKSPRALVPQDVDNTNGMLPSTPNRPSLLAISLHSSPLPIGEQTNLEAVDNDTKMFNEETMARKLLPFSHLREGNMSYSEPLTNSEELDRMLASAKDVPTETVEGSELSEVRMSDRVRTKPIAISKPPPSQSLIHSSSPCMGSYGNEDEKPFPLPHDLRHSLTAFPGCSTPPVEKSRHIPVRSLSMSMDNQNSQSESAPCFPPPRPSYFSNKSRTARMIPSTRHSICDLSSSNYTSPSEHNLAKTRDTIPPSLFDTARRPVTKLLRVLSKVRNNRDVVQSRLVKCITERETFLEILHYLQSLRTLVKSPPTTPLLYKPNATPDSVLTHIKRINRKAFSLLTMTRQSDDYYAASDNAASVGCAIPSSAARERGFSTLSNVEEECFYNEEEKPTITSPAHMFELDLQASSDEEDDEKRDTTDFEDYRKLSVDDVGKFASIRDLGLEVAGGSYVDDSSGSLMMKNSYEAESFVNKMLDSSTSFITTAQEASVMGNSYQSTDSGKIISHDDDLIEASLYQNMIEKTVKTTPYHSHFLDKKHLHEGMCSSPLSTVSHMSDDIAKYFRSETPETDRCSDPRQDSFPCTGSGISSLAQLGAPPREVLDMHTM